MNNGAILLVEDNPDDEALTLRALKKNDISNEVVVAHDGVEAVEILLGSSNGHAPPAIVLLDLKLPRMDGLEVLRRVRADPRTRLLPVVVLTTSKEEQDLINGYQLGATVTSASPWTSPSSPRRCVSLDCIGWC